jgi:rhodanese-related sulfurtransferase
MCGRPSTTIGFERLYNPLMRLGRPAFVAALTDGVPPRPLNMVAIEATNRGRLDARAAMLTSAPPVEEIDLDQVGPRQANGALVVDVREPSEFNHGHVPGALNVPQAELANRLAELPRDRELLVVCQAGLRSLRSAQWLTQAGLERVVSLRGGTGAWLAAGRPVAYGDTAAEAPAVRESEWAHAGALTTRYVAAPHI